MAKKFLVEKKHRNSYTDDGANVTGWSKNLNNGKVKSKYKIVEPDGDKTVIKQTQTPDAIKKKGIKTDTSELAKPSAIEPTKTLQGQDANHNVGGGGYDADKPVDVATNTPPKNVADASLNVTDDASLNVTDDVPSTEVSDPDTPGPGLQWFMNNWKSVAIVGAGLVALAAIVKALNKTIKVRYNKVVKSLQRAQKDFTTSPNGLDMKAVMPGVGSGIFDKIANLVTLNLSNWGISKSASTNNNIGIVPFCTKYKSEINDDFRVAQEAFSKIKLAADEIEQGIDKEKPENSSVNTKSYNSFYEALNSDVINESEKLDEIGAMAAVSAAISLGTLAVRAGSFVINKMKNGKPDDEGKVVQVTKQSTREICMAIINNYANKYINMQTVFSELGITTQSLADIDMSSCDKLAMILKKYQKPENNKITTKQYSRLQKAYENMLKHYYNIGDGIIKNFAKYTNADNEKDDNLLVSGKEKLQSMWDSQKDFYDNNFSKIVLEIISSYSAIAYNNFIVEKVIPVFKSGLAGDADYVLDAMPKKGEYYVLRQTQGQPWLENGEKEAGNTAIAEIVDYNKDTKDITFKLIARMENDGNITVDDKGIATVEGDVNYDFYTDGDGKENEHKLGYGKWLALDPAITEWRPVADRTKVYTYTTEQGVTYIVYATKDIRSKEDGYDTIYIGVLNKGMVAVSKVIKISLKVNITKQGFISIFEKLDVKFEDNGNNKNTRRLVDGIEKFKGEISVFEAQDVDAIVKIIAEIVAGTTSENSVENYLEYIKEHSEEFAQKIINETKKLEGKMDKHGMVQYKNTNVQITKDPVAINLGIKTKNGDAVIVYFSVGYDKSINNKVRYFIGFKHEYDAYAGYFPVADLKQVEVALIKICDAGINNNPLNDVDDFAGNTMSGEISLDKFFKVFSSLLTITNDNGNNILVVNTDPNGTVDVKKDDQNYYYVTSKTLQVVKDNQTQPVFIKVSPLNQDGSFNISSQIGKEVLLSAPIPLNNKGVLNTELKKYADTLKSKGYGILQKESVDVSYSHKIVNESVATNTVITRTFKNFPSKSYVLSESYFDLGNDTSKLSNSSFVKKFKTRANVYEYVKNNLDAKIFQLTESQTYKISSYTGCKPSLMTPLYENVYVVRFNSDDTVSSINYLGKFKIQ